MNKPEKAVQYFNNKFNCAQSVLAPFAEELGIDVSTSLKVSCAFGGGMGRMQKTCGAVTGALMALGLKYGKGINDDESFKMNTYRLTNEFAKRFTAINGSLDCITLLGYDWNTEEGKKNIEDKKLHDIICTKLVKDAVEITEKLLKE